MLTTIAQSDAPIEKNWGFRRWKFDFRTFGFGGLLKLDLAKLWLLNVDH
jgi:hypothetical protein